VGGCKQTVVAPSVFALAILDLDLIDARRTSNDGRKPLKTSSVLPEQRHQRNQRFCAAGAKANRIQYAH